MVTILTWLTNLMQGHIGLAVLGAFLWGSASVILSPCHLASIPLVIGYVTTQKTDKSRAFGLSFVFALGILISMLTLGIITGILGRMLGDIGVLGRVLGVLLFVGMGLYLLDILRLPSFSLPNQAAFSGGGYKASLILGVLFGTVLGPCAFAFFIPILGMVFYSVKSFPVYSGILIASYALGHSIVIVLAGTMASVLVPYMQKKISSSLVVWTRRVFGVAFIVAAVYMYIIP